MLTSVEGIFENGQIILTEIPPVQNKTRVVVTFLPQTSSPPVAKRRLGSLKGKIGIGADFNEPLDDLKDYMF